MILLFPDTLPIIKEKRGKQPKWKVLKTNLLLDKLF